MSSMPTTTSTSLRQDIAPLPLRYRGSGAATQAGWGGLMAAGQQGHAGAYRRLLGELREWLLQFYSRRLPPAYVEDAVQDALLSIHEKRHTYDPSRAFGPWLNAIARYKWIDRLRTLQRKIVALSDDISIEDHESAVMADTMLTKLLAGLPDGQAVAIRLVKLEGLTIEEASLRCGQSVSLVKVNIHRGLAKLAVTVQEHFDVD